MHNRQIQRVKLRFETRSAATVGVSLGSRGGGRHDSRAADDCLASDRTTPPGFEAASSAKPQYDGVL